MNVPLGMEQGPVDRHETDMAQKRRSITRDPVLLRLLWMSVGRFLYRLTFHNWYQPRQLILQAFGATMGERTKFRRTVDIDRPWNLWAGALVMIGDHAVLRARRPIVIGDRAVVSQLSVLSTEIRDLHRPGFLIGSAPITMEDDTWVAADALVLPGSIIRRGSVVGARSVVQGELPAWTVCAGEPATPRRPRHMQLPTNPAAV